MLQNKEGEKVPEVTFQTRANGDWIPLTSSEIFTNKKVIVFSLPGAFTPTCSSTHLPRYCELAKIFAGLGIDEIICLSVNDAFVMEAWRKNQNTNGITYLPDGNGAFANAMGMLVDKSDLGFGERSWRYSMMVNKGKIEKMFIEPDKPGDPFEVSDADTMLRYLAPELSLPDEVTIITKPGCRFCVEAKKILNDRDMRYEEIALGDGISYTSLRNLSGQSMAPQIFINGNHIGGLEALKTELDSKNG